MQRSSFTDRLSPMEDVTRPHSHTSSKGDEGPLPHLECAVQLNSVPGHENQHVPPGNFGDNQHCISSTTTLTSMLPAIHFEKQRFTIRDTLLCAYQTLGVIYGDLGTSPLYVYPTINLSEPTKDDYLGIFSIIFWTLTLIGLIKYVCIVLHADDHGEGGTFALYSLLCQHADISLTAGREYCRLDTDSRLSHFSKKLRVNSKTKDILEKNNFAKKLLLFIVILGTCMLIGDGILTPAISVLSAMEGIQQADAAISNTTVVILSVIVLVALFLIQSYGTKGVSYLFSPVMAIWLIVTALIGAYNVAYHYPGVFKALSPHYIIFLFSRNAKQGWTMLGGTVLCITGAEAMFADLGHFNKLSIQVAFSVAVYPCVLMTYAGQTAYLIKHPNDHNGAFYKSIPQPVYWPMFVIASMAAIVASQGLISATFSIIRQSVSLHYFPRVKLIHTSQDKEGQIYSPEVNYILMVLCLAVVIGFGDASTIGNAFGVAVILVMLITTMLLSLVMLTIWKINAVLVVTFTGIFGLVEGVYFTAVLMKIPQGGWLPFGISIVLVIIMLSWNYGKGKKLEYEMSHRVSVENLGSLLSNSGSFPRVPGLCFFYSDLLQGVPPIVRHYVRNVRSIHEIVIITTIRYIPVKTVLPSERFLVSQLEFEGFYRCIAQYGYMDIMDVEADDFRNNVIEILKDHVHSKSYPGTGSSESGSFEEAMATEQEIAKLESTKMAGAVYVFGKTQLRTSKKTTWSSVVLAVVYHFLQNNCRSAIATWKIPHSSFLEVGMVAEI